MSFNINSLAEYQQLYKESVENPEGFWANVASNFTWKKKWDKVLEWNFTEPKVEWFKGAKLNITENCIDRHLEDKADQPAIIWESNDPSEHHRVLTYKQLHQKVCLFANVLKNNGVKKGDRVCIYMPMVPELAIAVLACARIGAIHSVIFGGFSAQSIADRINDAKCEMVITADGGFRGTKDVPLKNVIDDALVQCPSVKTVIVLTRTRTPISMIKGRDKWWIDEIHKVETLGLIDCPTEEMDAEDELFILYTSGSTGKPKGVVHTCAGYMVYAAYTFQNVFQYQPKDIYFCTADVGWITGHSYIIYGPLAQGATTLMFEGVPTYPDAGRFWDIVDKFKVNILYTAPTAIRSLMQSGLDYVKNKDLSSLKVLGSVGEPINEEAWNWYNEHIGKRKCPIVDTWWQTETGGLMISPIAGITPLKPAFATLPLPGVQPILVDENGKEIEGNGVNGNLCIKYPWPSIIRTTYGDHERCKTTYFSTYKGLYFTGDGCMRDEDGYYRITGRVDDVMNISGHRISTTEVESALVSHPSVAEAAVVGANDATTGQAIIAYVTLRGGASVSENDLRNHVAKEIGAIAKPKAIFFTPDLPKTRSGKIMRRLLKDVAENRAVGDATTLADPNVMKLIAEGLQSATSED